MIQNKTHTTKQPKDNLAENQMAEIAIFGRTLFENGTEIPCQTTEISTNTIKVQSAIKPKLNEKIIFYIDEIGRLVGTVNQTKKGEFTSTIIATEHKKNKLKAQINWLKLKQQQKVKDNRKNKRIIPRQQNWKMKIENKTINVEIVDISLSGAFLKYKQNTQNSFFNLGTKVNLAGITAHIVRQTQNGIAVEFVV